jgi:hypothetical protein
MSSRYEKYNARKGGEHNKEDKMKRLKKAIDEKSMKVLNYEQVNENELSYHILGNSGSFYDVKFTNTQMSCSCPDHARHHSYCKHIYLVYIKIFHLIPDLDAVGNGITEMQFVMMRNAHDRFMEAQTKKKEIMESRTSKWNGYRFNKDDECPICFDVYGEMSIFGCKTCKNCFHMGCMESIFRYNSKCPMCRSVVRKTDVEAEEEDKEVDEIANRIKNTILDL